MLAPPGPPFVFAWKNLQRTEAERAHIFLATCTHTFALTHIHTRTVAVLLQRSPRQECVRWWMCCIYFLQTAGLQCGQRDREGHRSTHTLAPILTRMCVCVCVSAHPGCCPVPVSDHGSSGGGLRATFSLPICPGTAFASLGLPSWQAELPQWWMTVRLVSVSESCTSATCRVGPCQRLPVGSAILCLPLPPSLSLSLSLYPALHLHLPPLSSPTLFSSLVGPAQKLEQGVEIIPEIGCQPDNFWRTAEQRRWLCRLNALSHHTEQHLHSKQISLNQTGWVGEEFRYKAC